jgi:hypothetical protein
MYKGELLACLLFLNDLTDEAITKEVESLVDSNHDILKEFDKDIGIRVVAAIERGVVTPFLKENIDVLDL